MRNIARTILRMTARFRQAPRPIYNITLYELSDESGYKYRSIAKVCGITAVGYGPSKTIARRNSARVALRKLGCFENAPEADERTNYVRVLSDFAELRGNSLPEYSDVPNADTNAPYVIKCQYLKYEIDGFGNTPDEAKRNSARSMMELLLDKRVMPFIYTRF